MKSPTLVGRNVRASAGGCTVRTAIRMEPEFWEALEAAAARRGLRRNALVVEISRDSPGKSLTAAVRVWLLREALAWGIHAVVDKASR